VTDKVRKDVVLLRHGGWFEPQKQEDGSTLDVHGNANSILSQMVPLSMSIFLLKIAMTDPYFYSWFEFSKVRILLEMQRKRSRRRFCDR